MPSAGARDRFARGWSLGAPLVALLVVGGAFVLTAAGQRSEALSFVADGSLNLAFGRLAGILRIGLPVLLGIAAGALVIAALVTRRIRDAVVAVALVVAATLAAEGLKLLLRRPVLAASDGIDGNSFPSGHVAVTVALALAVATLAPRRVVLLALAVLALGATWSSIVSFAHRPSDAVGGALVCAVVGRIVLWRRRTVGDAHPALAIGAIVLLVAALGAVALGGASAGGLRWLTVGWLVAGAAATASALLVAPTRRRTEVRA